jgi:ACS family tartrate transporter-like MFS transporter
MPTPRGELRSSALDSAVRKATWRLMPLVFLCYAIAYVNRSNVSIAGRLMADTLPGFTMAVFGAGSGIFFLGYFLLEIPGSLIVEKWSARKWITRIMVTWGIVAALTAAVKTPFQFQLVRFVLGLAEAGFFPGVIVFLTHWFPRKARARALSVFMIATPVAQIVSPPISSALGVMGDTTVAGKVVHHATLLGMHGWQWIYIAWGIPAVFLGICVFFWLTDRPRQATWLTAEEREALEAELERERAEHRGVKRMTVWAALSHPRVLLLALAYFLAVTASYGVEFFLPTVLLRWYSLSLTQVGWLIILPPILALAAILGAGWSSDRLRERRFHAAVPVLIGGIFLAMTPLTHGNLAITILFFMVAWAGFKAYLPAFWSLPNTFLSDVAAAGSIGLINSLGNLGGFVGPVLLGKIETITGSFVGGLYYLGASMLAACGVILYIGGARPGGDSALHSSDAPAQANSSARTS